MLNTSKTLNWLSSVSAFPAPTPEAFHEIVVLLGQGHRAHRIPITRKRERNESILATI
jgi:hypothetical protein